MYIILCILYNETLGFNKSESRALYYYYNQTFYLSFGRFSIPFFVIVNNKNRKYDEYIEIYPVNSGRKHGNFSRFS